MAGLPYAAGDWFAIPLRFGLFAVGRAVAVDPRGAILGYFFGRFFERLPKAADLQGLAPGDADLIGVCDQHGLRSGEWPLIAPAAANDSGPWPIPMFRSIDPASGTISWKTFAPDDLLNPITSNVEPADAGVRNWGIAMAALEPGPMSWAAVEFTLWRCFRSFQNGMHRKYIADLQREISASTWA